MTAPAPDDWKPTSRERATVRAAAGKLAAAGLGSYRDDLMQEALIALWRRRPPPHGAYRTARNAMVDYLRREMGRPGHSSLRHASSAAQGDFEGEKVSLDDPAAIVALSRSLDRMPAALRCVLGAAMATEEKQEVAAALGISAGRLSQRLAEIRHHFAT